MLFRNFMIALMILFKGYCFVSALSKGDVMLQRQHVLKDHKSTETKADVY